MRHVSWDDIQEFETVLNDEFRLPSESEWEYACRAGTQTRYYWGDDPNNEDINDFAVNQVDVSAVVGTKLPNSWGLYDLAGNVIEWCEDDWHDDYSDAPDDGSAWFETPRDGARIYRGGRFGNSPPYECRSA